MGLSNRVVDFLFHPDSHLTATNKGIFGTTQVKVGDIDRNIGLIDTFLLLPFGSTDAERIP